MTTQGARKTVKADVIDLDALLNSRSTTPKIVTLGGKDWEIRANLTSEEVLQFWALNDDATRSKKGEAPGPIRAMALIFGSVETAVEFDGIVQHLPRDINLEVWRRVLKAAGIKVSLDDDEGESSAS